MCISLLKLAQLQKIEVKLKRHKLIWYTVKGFANCGVVRGASGGIQPWAQALGTHQHTLYINTLCTSTYSPERRLWGRINTQCSHFKTHF